MAFAREVDRTFGEESQMILLFAAFVQAPSWSLRPSREATRREPRRGFGWIDRRNLPGSKWWPTPGDGFFGPTQQAQA